MLGSWSYIAILKPVSKTTEQFRSAILKRLKTVLVRSENPFIAVTVRLLAKTFRCFGQNNLSYSAEQQFAISIGLRAEGTIGVERFKAFKSLSSQFT